MSINVRLVTTADEKLWSDYVQRHDASIYFDLRWRSVIKQVFGHNSYYVIATDDTNRAVGILPLVLLKSRLFGQYLVSMPFLNYGGIVADDAEVRQQLLTFAEQLRENLAAEHVELRENFASEDSQLPTRLDKVTMLLDLPSDYDDLWQAIGSKRRAQVKRPIREGAEFCLGGAELLDDFYQVFAHNMRDLGTPVYSKKLFKTILSIFPENVSIAVVSLNGKAVGAAFLISHQGHQEIPWASTLREYNRLGINMFMYWNVLKSAIESGHKQFDFGRSSKDAGTLKFKKQWGAKPHQLYWHYLLKPNSELPALNHSNPKYKLLIDLWKKMPVAVCNTLGPHIVKGLP